MNIWHWLALYVAIGALCGLFGPGGRHSTREDVGLMLVVGPLLVVGWIAMAITWLISPRMRRAMRRETLADYGGRASAEQLKKDLTGD